MPYNFYIKHFSLQGQTKKLTFTLTFDLEKVIWRRNRFLCNFPWKLVYMYRKVCIKNFLGEKLILGATDLYVSVTYPKNVTILMFEVYCIDYCNHHPPWFYFSFSCMISTLLNSLMLVIQIKKKWKLLEKKKYYINKIFHICTGIIHI